MKAAIVTPWFGQNLTGGAERLSWELAFGLNERLDHLSVLTTCAGSFHDPWNADVHAAGETEIDGLRVVRFPVDRANRRRFAEVNRKLLALPRERLHVGAPLLDERECEDFVRHNINSTMLLSHLARHDGDFDAFIFLPYMYGLILRGWRVAPERTAIVPCLHDEPYAYLPPIVQMMRGAARLLFSSVGTFEVARRIYGPGILPRSTVVGCGIAWPQPPSGNAAIQGFTPGEHRYVLYLGRRTPEKNVDLLVAAFERYCEYRPASNLRLVLAGPDSPVVSTSSERVIFLHDVSEAEKSMLLRSALALAQPSTNESFSRTMMESWAVGRPVLVHSNCLATATALDETNAGWSAGDFNEWVDALADVDTASAAELHARGARASGYVERYGAWPRVLDAFEAALHKMISATQRPIAGARRIVHFVENAGYADSTTLLALQNDALLKRHRVSSTIVSVNHDSRLGTLVAEPDTLRFRDLRIDYVASNGREMPIGPAILTGTGVPRFCDAIGAVRPFPVFVDAAAWNVDPSPEIMTPLQDGRTNVLVVARIAPPSRQLDIALVFRAYYTLDFDARLLLVGHTADTEYLEALRTTISKVGLEHRILVTGEVSRPALAAMYASAHLFVSYRDRYETGLSLFEAMAFDIPICAIGCDQSRDILAGSGVIVNDGSPDVAMAALWRVLVSDTVTRQKVIASQRRRLAQMRETDALSLLTAAAGMELVQ